jgi:hypothetical protein
VRLDDHGATGSAINVAFRLLESAALRSALAGSPGVLALMASEWFFEEVIRHNPASRPGAFRPTTISVKETKVTAWLRLPDGAAKVQPAASLAARWRDRVARDSGWSSFRCGVAITASLAFLIAGVVSGILLDISRPSAGVATGNVARVSVAAPLAACGVVAEDGFRSHATTTFTNIQTVYTISLDGRRVSVMQGTYDGVAYDWLQSDPTGDRAGMQLRWFDTPSRWHYCGKQVTFQACIWHQLPFTSQCSSYL